MNNAEINNTYHTSSPHEVFRAISADFRLHGMTQSDAAKKLGFKSKQTLSNLLASKKYLSAFQAIRFRKAFGYNPNFLISGQGKLKDEDDTLRYKSNHESSWKELLMAEPGASELGLLRSYFRRVIEAWGNPVAKIILTTYQQISACNDVSTLIMLASKIEDKLYELKEQATLEPDTKPLTTQEICEAVSKDFKRRRITHQIAADKIGAPRHTVTNQLSRKKRFGERLAKKFSEAFGYSLTWLLYGEGEMFSDGNDAIKFKGK